MLVFPAVIMLGVDSKYRRSSSGNESNTRVQSAARRLDDNVMLYVSAFLLKHRAAFDIC